MSEDKKMFIRRYDNKKYIDCLCVYIETIEVNNLSLFNSS